MDKFVVRLKRANEESVDDAIRQQHEMETSVTSAAFSVSPDTNVISVEQIESQSVQNQDSSVNNFKNGEFVLKINPSALLYLSSKIHCNVLIFYLKNNHLKQDARLFIFIMFLFRYSYMCKYCWYEKDPLFLFVVTYLGIFLVKFGTF